MKFKAIRIFFLLTPVIFSCKDNKVDPAAAQLTSEVTAIDRFILGNVQDFVFYSSAGIRMAIHKFGNDAPPQQGQLVTVAYVGKLFADNTVFSSGTIQDKPENISVNGLKLGVASLLNGSVATLYIPSVYGYGTAGTSNVPPNATLKYEVTILGVQRTFEQQAQFQSDTAAIHEYLKDSTGFVGHSSGISYKINASGTGSRPNPYNNITFEYVGIIMSNGSTFDKITSPNQVYLYNLIDGLKIGIPLMNEGGSATFYIPSGLAYGKTGAGAIGANANLRFDIKLDSIVQ